MKKVFLDANVLLYLFVKSREFSEYSVKAIKSLIEKTNLYTSSDITPKGSRVFG